MIFICKEQLTTDLHYAQSMAEEKAKAAQEAAAQAVLAKEEAVLAAQALVAAQVTATKKKQAQQERQDQELKDKKNKKQKINSVSNTFAHAVFRDADKNGDGLLTKTEIRKYFKAHPIEKAHILGPDFKWKVFFTRMDKDGDAQFDIDEFTEAVSKVYHVDMFTESKEEAETLRVAMKAKADSEGVAPVTPSASASKRGSISGVHKCTICGDEKEKSGYSGSQWKKNRKKGTAKCLLCAAK